MFGDNARNFTFEAIWGGITEVSVGFYLFILFRSLWSRHRKASRGRIWLHPEYVQSFCLTARAQAVLGWAAVLTLCCPGPAAPTLVPPCRVRNTDALLTQHSSLHPRSPSAEIFGITMTSLTFFFPPFSVNLEEMLQKHLRWIFYFNFVYNRFGWICGPLVCYFVNILANWFTNRHVASKQMFLAIWGKWGLALCLLQELCQGSSGRSCLAN